MRIRAILEFRKPRASFASFANKFVYRGIAAGLVPPVSLRLSRSRTFRPSLRSPRFRNLLSTEWEAGGRIEDEGQSTEQKLRKE